MSEIVQINGKDWPVIEWRGQRVITTAQLAKMYEASEQQVKQNFNNNKVNFTQETHYFYLQGEELKTFKNMVDNFDLVGKNANQLYLWTHQGASRHCKILGTKKAWNQFDVLENSYYNPKPLIDKVIDDILQNPDYGIRLLTAYKEEKEARALAEEQKESLQTELDYSKDWFSIKRVAAMNGVSWKTFNWKKLKQASNDMGYGVKKIFDANYGEVNTYHREVWEEVYPQYEI